MAACLERELSSRQTHGGDNRIKAARFPQHKTLEDFDFSYQRSIRKEVVAHLGALDFVEAKDNVIFLGPPGTGKSHLAISLGVRACQAGHRVAFATAAQWVDRLGEAHHKGLLHDELVRLGRTPLLIIDEVGYIPFEAEAANLFFQLVSSRYERASVIVTSNKPFGRWGEVFGDATVAAAMIDRLVYHAEVVSLKGDSYRLRDRVWGGCLTTTLRDHIAGQGVKIQPAKRGQFSTGVDTRGFLVSATLPPEACLAIRKGNSPGLVLRTRATALKDWRSAQSNQG